MLDLNRQKEFILAKGKMQFRNSDYIYDEDIDYIADHWELSPELERFVGESGRKSFSLELDSSVIDRDKADELRRYENEAVYSLRSLFHYQLVDVAKEITNKEVSVKFLKIVEDAPSLVHGLQLRDSKGKTTVSYAYAKDILGDEIPNFTRKSALKTAEKLSMDILTKEFYNYVKETETYKKAWEDFSENLEKYQTLASRDIVQKGTLFLSALPEDILTASDNAYRWGSCFADGGAYQTNPYHYIRMANVMIAYFIADNAKSKTFKIANHEVSNKSWRVMVYLTTKGNLSFSSQQYPFSSSSAMESILKTLQEEFGGELDINRGITPDSENVYHDGSEYMLKFSEAVSIWEFVSTERLICPVSGESTHENPESLQAFRSISELDLQSCDSCGDVTVELTQITAFNSGEDIHRCEYCLEDTLFSSEIEEFVVGVDDTVSLVFESLSSEPYPIHRYQESRYSNNPNYEEVNVKFYMRESQIIPDRIHPAYIEKGYDIDESDLWNLADMLDYPLYITRAEVVVTEEAE